MSRRILVKEAGLMNFFKSFFKAKSVGNESEWIQQLRKVDSDLADIWSKYDKTLDTGARAQKASLEKLGLDTSHIDDFMKKYDIK
jgi:hypothetical protein